jgi:hypothetical protein
MTASHATLPDWGKLTPARKVELIRELYQPESTSATDLSNRILTKYGQRVPRNAVIGLYSRMPELRRDYPLTGINQNSVPSSAKSEFFRKQEEQRKAAREAGERQEPSMAPPLAPHIANLIAVRRTGMEEWAKKNAENVTLLELETGMCKFPTNEGGPFRFCGCSTPIVKQVRAIYCNFHARIATTRVSED